MVGDTERIAVLDRLGTAVIGGGSRRLLGDDSSGGSRQERWIDDALEDVLSFGDTWNHTASPCNELVGAFIESPSSFHGGGGVLDRMGLVKCIRWRKAGRGIINTLNLTSMMVGGRQTGDDATKNVQFSNVLGVRQRCANRTRDGRISQTNAPKESSAPCLICWSCIFCSNECGLRQISGILSWLV